MKSGINGALLRGLVSLGAIGLIVYSMKGKFSESLAILRSEVILEWFLLGFAVYLAAHIILALRLSSILRVHHIRMKLGEIVYLVFIGLFFNLFFPSAVGGDVAKAYFAYKHSGKKVESMTAIIVDRLMGFAALMGMAVGAVLLFGDQIPNPNIKYIVFAAAFVLILSLLFLGNKSFARSFKALAVLVPSLHLREKISILYHSLYAYRNHVKALAYGILLSLIGQALFVLVHYIMSLSLGAQLNLQIFFILIPVVTIVSMAPSFGGLGVREAGLMYVFQRYLTSERAFALTLLVDCAIYGVSLLAGIVFSLRGGLKPRIMHEMEKLK